MHFRAVSPFSLLLRSLWKIVTGPGIHHPEKYKVPQKLGLPGLPRAVSTLRNTWGVRNPLPSSMHWGKSRTSNAIVHQLCDLRCHLPSLGFSFPNRYRVLLLPFQRRSLYPPKAPLELCMLGIRVTYQHFSRETQTEPLT